MSDDPVLHEATERVGTVLGGKYHLDRVLGVGGMAIVYAATHRNRKKFAVKVLHAELSVRRDLRARFLREGYVANSVNHPGVVAVLDDDVDDDGSAFLVMELLEGATLDALGSRLNGRLPVREALAVAHQLLDVLAVAHESAIIHRDIKPANLFVSTEGNVKVLDFGIARLRDVAAGVQSTRAGAILGTPSFMAPEQALAHGDEIDPRTDIWAAGACLFTMLSGQFVHEGDNARQLMIRAATVPARSLGDVAPDTPSPVVELVAKALAFEKSARWDSATAMREAVARIHRELYGEMAREHLKTCLEQAPPPVESARTVPSPRDGTRLHVAKNAVKVPTVVGTAPDSPNARRRGAESDVATTTSKPVANARSADKPRRTRTAVVVALVVTAVGLSGAAFMMRSARTSSEDDAMSVALKPRFAPETVAATPPTPTPSATEAPPPASGTPLAASAAATTAAPLAVVPTPRTTPEPASIDPRTASSAGMPRSPLAKANAPRLAPRPDPPKRDPLHIELQ